MINSDNIAVLFDQVFFDTKDRLFSYIRKFVPEKMEAEDILQQCYLKLWENRHQLRDQDHVFPLLFTYAKSRVVDLYRREAVKAKYLQSQYLAEEPAIHPNEQIDSKEYKRLLTQAIDKLPARSKEVFLLKKEYGLTYTQIAEQLNVTTSAVENHMSRALKLLRKELQGNTHLGIYLVLLSNIYDVIPITLPFAPVG